MGPHEALLQPAAAARRPQARQHCSCEKHFNALLNRVLAEGLACHYCGVPLNLYAHAYDFKTALSLDHKVPLSRRPDNSAANLIICCVRCNFAKARTSYEEFKATVQRMRAEDRTKMNRYLDSLYEQRRSRPRFRTEQRPA